MSATAVSCLVLQVLPYLINTDELNLGAKVCFGMSAVSHTPYNIAALTSRCKAG